MGKIPYGKKETDGEGAGREIEDYPIANEVLGVNSILKFIPKPSAILFNNFIVGLPEPSRQKAGTDLRLGIYA